MVLRRCAWHGQFHGYRVVYGVSSWRGQGISFTDGLCARCAAILHNDLQAGAAGGAPRRGRSVSHVRPELASIALSLMVVVAGVVAARPLGLEIFTGSSAEAPLVASPGAPAPSARLAIRPASKSLPHLFTAKADVETVETASPDTGRSHSPARRDRLALAYTPWVARPRALSFTASPAAFEPSPPPSRTLLALSTDPTALLSLQAP